jgi:hypothetical protein
MRSLTPILAAVLLAAAPSAVTVGFAEAQTCTCPPSGGEGGAEQPRIIADEAPPPLPEYDQPPLPAPGYIWTPGYWNWNNDDYYWVPGTWVAPPRPGLLWTPGYWAFANGAYLFHRGYWGPRVGFYGGVSYGFGYYGNGFEGGRWDGDRFFYNRTVNNFGSVNITNVYERPAPRIVERVSFNGGPDGVRARPTPEQIAIAREKHIPPTVAQRHNVRAASRNEAAFVTNNQGKPPVAATQKPGDFKGAVVAPAKAAGGPIKARPLDETGAGRNEVEKGKPGAERPELKGEKPDVRPEAQRPEGQRPEGQKPEGQRPEGQKPEARPEKPDARPGKPEARPEKPEARPGKPDGKPEGRPEKPEGRPQSKPDARPAKPEGRPEPKAEPRPAPKAEPRPAPKAEPRPAPRAEPRPAPRAEPRPAPRAEPRAAPRPAPERGRPEGRREEKRN